MFKKDDKTVVSSKSTASSSSSNQERALAKASPQQLAPNLQMSTKRGSFFNHLPTNVLAHVFSFLPYNSLPALNQVSKLCLAVVTSTARLHLDPLFVLIDTNWDECLQALLDRNIAQYDSSEQKIAQLKQERQGSLGFVIFAPCRIPKERFCEQKLALRKLMDEIHDLKNPFAKLLHFSTTLNKIEQEIEVLIRSGKNDLDHLRSLVQKHQEIWPSKAIYECFIHAEAYARLAPSHPISSLYLGALEELKARNNQALIQRSELLGCLEELKVLSDETSPSTGFGF